MIKNIFIFESQRSWRWLDGLYSHPIVAGGLFYGMGISFTEDFLRKRVQLCVDQCVPENVAKENSWIGQLNIRLSQFGVKVLSFDDLDVSGVCWQVRIKENSWSILGPGGIHNEGNSLDELRKFFHLDVCRDGRWSYLIEKDWRWKKVLVPKCSRIMSLIIWDAYVFDQGTQWDLNLLDFLGRMVASGVDSFRLLFCVGGGDDKTRSFEEAKAELRRVKNLGKNVSCEFVIWNLRFSAGEGVGGHGRYMIGSTFAVRSGKGFSFVADRRARTSDKMNRFDADSVDLFSCLCRDHDSLTSFSRVVRRVVEIAKSDKFLSRQEIGGKMYLMENQIVSSKKAEQRVLENGLTELERIWA